MSAPKSSISIRGSIIECESITLRVSPGEYHNFPIVDNKGLFAHYRRTNEDGRFQLVTNLLEESETFAIYKKVGGFLILVCAFTSLEEINTEALAIINSSEELRNSILFSIGGLNDKERVNQRN
ncbi:TPA: hypothetical protein RPG34_003226 [Yersinia enterocolitica]|nr:hypothetical protein [Yersinia enterocolitica]